MGRLPSFDIAQVDMGRESAGLIQRRVDMVSIMHVPISPHEPPTYERAFVSLAKLVKLEGVLVFSETSFTK